MKHENSVSAGYDWLSPSCENLHFHERKKTVHTRFAYIVFLFVKSENNTEIHIKEIKHVLLSYIVILNVWEMFY